MNSSLDFLNMIKNQSVQGKLREKKAVVKESTSFTPCNADRIAVIDTETNWHDAVMSLGVAIADAQSFKCVDKRYYIFEPECYVGGIYSNVMNYRGVKGISGNRDAAIADLEKFLLHNNVKKILAYNAKFDYGHLPELQHFEWFDIMRLAAYKQYNRAIPESALCCKTGRLKSNYGVEPIMRMLTGDARYKEIHNAVYDAVDELKIVELLGHSLETYECAKL